MSRKGGGSKPVDRLSTDRRGQVKPYKKRQKKFPGRKNFARRGARFPFTAAGHHTLELSEGSARSGLLIEGRVSFQSGGSMQHCNTKRLKSLI